MRGKVLMIQGTASHVGKSLLCVALGRIFKRLGCRVAPFKAQNMSNNSAVCRDGGEISRAQALQAQACGVEPTVEMNPVLLKPSAHAKAQVIVRGRPTEHMSAMEYHEFKPSLLPVVEQSLASLRAQYDLVVIEGAGSPAEINLKANDIVNMRIAKSARAPVILVGDIDAGGVFAQIVGTLELLEPDERDLIRGFAINKFRGDKRILDPGLSYLENRTGRKVLGVIPYRDDIRLPEEDTLGLPGTFDEERRNPSALSVQVVRLPHISNFTDFDCLAADPRLHLEYISHANGHGAPEVLALPGTKSTIEALHFLRQTGLGGYVRRCHEAGSLILGICGGFQLLGERIVDAFHVESVETDVQALGLLPVVTVFAQCKTTANVEGHHVESGAEVRGYEIHHGCTQGYPGSRPLFRITERNGMTVEGYDGYAEGNIWGTYIHGLFDSRPFRDHFVRSLLQRHNAIPSGENIEAALGDPIDTWADTVRSNLDIDYLQTLIEGS